MSPQHLFENLAHDWQWALQHEAELANGDKLRLYMTPRNAVVIVQIYAHQMGVNLYTLATTELSWTEFANIGRDL